MGALAVGGGYVGLAIGSERAFNVQLLEIFLMLPFMALYAWGMWCGIRLIEGTKGSLEANRWFWAYQIPIVSSPFISYMVASGALLNIVLHPEGFRFSIAVRFGSQFGASWMQDQPWSFGINIFALCISSYLTWRLREEGLE